MTEALEEIILKGAPISEGVSIGKLYFMEDFPDDIIPEFPIQSSDVENEIARYRKAVLSSREDLHTLQRFLAKEGSSEAASIIDTHIQMLEDPFMTTFVEKKIRQMMKNTESVFRTVMSDYEKEFSKIKDSFFKQRLLDVKDLSNRILRHLYPREQVTLSDLPEEGVVIFTKELVPSLTAESSASQVFGFITEMGGATSHAALIARSKGIPYISNIDVETLRQFEECDVIIDADQGMVILNPSLETIDHYKGKKERKKPAFQKEKKDDSKVETLDGCAITLLANIESIADLDLIELYGANGVGLFRSEFLFFGKELHSFSEEEQYDLYLRVMENAKGRPLTFRTFDVGGDKGSISRYEPEPNPALGCRAIRFLLRNRDIFIMQLRALMRVSLEGDLRILLPLISDVTELIEAKELIQEVAIDLRKEGYQIADEIPVGSMIEVPSAVIICDLIAKECDFLSIGTNDLLQYTLATDRTHQDLHSFCKSSHPSIIRMVRQVVKEGVQSETPVSLCGEMAADPLMLPLLLGLGVRSFSCAPRYIPAIRNMAKRLTLAECQDQIEDIMKLETCQQVEQYLQERYEKLISEISL
ncbi:phosphoenolpyruvate--protein phosphotransferase [Simkania sp.]|uniref:phosphoenolpyruvate--protein phosphotransferase n=1 Tax=Simkania sp. TaxID=34094 RepID=UPI003B52DA86